MLKKLTWWMACFALCFLVCPARAEIRGYDKAQGGYQYISFGTYPYESDGAPKPVLWEILSVENERATMLTCEILDVHQVIDVTDESDIKNYNYRKIASFSESDLYAWMNGEMLQTLLGDSPLKNALIEGENGYLYPLLDEQLLDPEIGFTKGVYKLNKPRIAKASPYCVSRGIYVDHGTGGSTYWGADIKAENGYKQRIVGYDGHLSWGVYSRKNIGIRAALTLDLSRLTLLSGTGAKDDPYIFASDEGEAEKKKPQSPEPQAATAPSADAAQENTSETLTLSFVGDMSIGDATQAVETAASLTNTIRNNGYAWPFSLISQYLLSDDYSFGNLEVNLTQQKNLKSSKVYNMIGQPDFVHVLLEGGIDAVNTVNNHCMDFTELGYRDTLSVLDEAGVNHFGTVYPGTERGSDILGTAIVKGVKLGMVGFSYPSDNDLPRIKKRIETLKSEQGCDLVIVSLHWGRETYLTSQSWQYAFAKKVIDMGADVIWGHHPHVVQPIYLYEGKPIFFSTGNFIFGTMSSVDPSTGIFQLSYSLENDEIKLSSLRVIPCQTGAKGDYRPYELTQPKEREECLGKIRGNKDVKGLERLPETFLQTGIALFD